MHKKCSYKSNRLSEDVKRWLFIMKLRKVEHSNFRCEYFSDFVSYIYSWALRSQPKKNEREKIHCVSPIIPYIHQNFMEIHSIWSIDFVIKHSSDIRYHSFIILRTFAMFLMSRNFFLYHHHPVQVCAQSQTFYLHKIRDESILTF